MKRLDLKTLRAATEKVVTTPYGAVTVRRLGRLEYLTLLPPDPPELARPPRTGNETEAQIQTLNDEAVARELAWLASLPPADRVSRRAEMLEALYMAIARAVIDPKMTVEDAKRLGDDAHVIFQEMQEFWKAEVKAMDNGGAEARSKEPKDPDPVPEPEPEPEPEPAKA
jgi:hypothetical protein